MNTTMKVQTQAATKKITPKKAPAKKGPAFKNPFSKGSPKSGAPTSPTAVRLGRTVWLPSAGFQPPAYLDGSLPGDAGFDPLGLSAPYEYLQFDLDALDQNAAQNPSGNVIGKVKPNKTTVEQGSIVPYSEAFGLERFRECELIHGRWAMLAVTGAVACEALTGVTWADAGAVELEQSQYLGLNLPLDTYSLTWIEVLLVGYLEVARSQITDPTMRCYPGGNFDPLGLSNTTPEKLFRLKTAEIKHGRVCMVAMLGLAGAAVNGHTSAIFQN